MKDENATITALAIACGVTFLIALFSLHTTLTLAKELERAKLELEPYLEKLKKLPF